jgi:selenocysteine-specific elongation factor
VLEGDRVRRADFTLTLSSNDAALRGRILDTIRAAGYEAPEAATVAAALGEDGRQLRPVLDLLVTEGVLSRTKEGFYFDAALMDALIEKVIDVLESKGQLGVGDVKDLTGASRKYAIPIIEFLDGRKVTQRQGDTRVAGPKGRRA